MRGTASIGHGPSAEAAVNEGRVRPGFGIPSGDAELGCHASSLASSGQGPFVGDSSRNPSQDQSELSTEIGTMDGAGRVLRLASLSSRV